MDQDRIFTVEQVAAMLDMHPRTIRRHIRDGKLRATKIGGEWRVRAMDMEGLMSGYAGEMRQQVMGDVTGFVEGKYSEFEGKIQVCTVIDYYVERQEDAAPLSQALMGVMNSGDPDQHSARFNYVFHADEGKARFVLWGNPRFLAKMLVVAGEYC